MANLLCFPTLATSYLNASQMSNVTIVLLYAAILVIVTSMVSLRTNDPDPMLAGRNMPWWLIAGSIVGTGISSMGFLIFPTHGYTFDLNFLVSNCLGTGLSIAIVYSCFVAFLRKNRDASIYTLLGDRFGRWSAIYASVAFIAYSTIKMGAITCLVAQVIHLICGADILSVMVLTGLIVIFYTYMSGIEGVIWTDLFQTIIFVLVALASIVFVINAIPHPTGKILEMVRTCPDFIEKTQTLKTNWPLLITTCLFFTSTGVAFYGSNQGIAQRYIVARSSSHAKWGLAISGLITPWVIALFFGLGILLYVLNNYSSEIAIHSYGGIENIFAYFIANHFPDGLKGFAIIGILAAAMSTIDTGINSSSTVLICNLYEPYAKASLPRQSLLTTQILRTSSALFGVAGIFAAYLIHLNGQDTLEFFWKGLGIVTSGVFGLFILIRISKKAGPKSAIGGLLVGSVIAFWMTFTAGMPDAWASRFHYMLTLPVSALAIVIVGLGLSYAFKEESRELHELSLPSCKARTQMAQKRKRAKKNIFSDSLRPKPLYQLYAAMTLIVAFVIHNEGTRLGLIEVDYFLINVASALLVLVAVLPFIIEDTTNKGYAVFMFTCLGIALPFIGAIALFTHPDEHLFGYFYLVSLAGLGTMIGWTMLGLVSMIATAAAAQISAAIYPSVGIPDNWATITIWAIGIFTYFAMDAAKENLVTERTLGCIHTIVTKIYEKITKMAMDLMIAKRNLNFKDLDHLAKLAGDVKLMTSALLGATDVNPEETQLELSVRETIEQVVARFSLKAQQALMIEGDADFNVLGCRDTFDGIIWHVLDNAFYYVDEGDATTVICSLDAHKKTLTVSNNGPQIHPKHRPYIFDIGFNANKDSLGLGLTYCKKMLEGMRSGIRLVSKSGDSWVRFKLYFPKYAHLPEEARIYPIKDREEIFIEARAI